MYKRKITSKTLIVCLLLIISVFYFSGCQSTDKTQSFLDASTLTNSTFQYDSENDTTEITWTASLTNNTIYSINRCYFTFNLYDISNNLLDSQDTSYNIQIKNGGTFYGNCHFTAQGNVAKITLDSWHSDYDNLWQTYMIWFLAMIILAGVGAIIYIIFMIIEDLELEDIIDFFEESGWMILIFAIVILPGGAYALIESYWVPLLIVLGGIIAFALIILLAHLIKYVVENADFSTDTTYYENSDDKDFDNDAEDIADYIKDVDKLNCFNLSQLKDYCRDNEIRGYSTMNKNQIIDLITNNGKNTKNMTRVNKVNTSNIKFEDIAGLEEVKKTFKEKVVYAFEHKNLYEKFNKKVGGGILLYGLPGTGKTMFAEAASNETDALFIPIKCSDIKSKWYGESENNVKKIFDKARKAKKAIIFFDEFEAIGAKRTDESDNGNNDLVPQILSEMQGIGSENTDNIVMVMAATNKPWAIDSAFLRPGRFDEKIYIPLPDFNARKKLFELKLKDVPQKDLDFDYLSTKTENFNGADITEFCDKLKMNAINRSIKENEELPITMEDVKIVIKTIRSSVSQNDVQRLKDFEKNF